MSFSYYEWIFVDFKEMNISLAIVFRSFEYIFSSFLKTANRFQLLIKNPPATFLVSVSGDSMTGAGIYPNDILVVDLINKKYGKGSIRLAGIGFDSDWKTSRNHISKRYTCDNWNERSDFSLQCLSDRVLVIP